MKNPPTPMTTPEHSQGGESSVPHAELNGDGLTFQGCRFIPATDGHKLTAQQLAKIVRAANNFEALVGALEQNTRMLEMCVQLVGDSPHVAKVIFLNEQIEANRAALRNAQQP